MDLRMPVLSGEKATAALKGNSETAKIPIVALTASVLNTHLLGLIDQGFDGYLRKPIHQLDLLKELAKFLPHEIQNQNSADLDIVSEKTEKDLDSQSASNLIGLESLSKEIIDRILEVTANHPYHVQQLTHHLWRLTSEVADTITFELALEELLLNNDILFRRETENLTPLQLRYLSAIINKEPQLNSMKTIIKYKLGSPGNLSTIKAALDPNGIMNPGVIFS